MAIKQLFSEKAFGCGEEACSSNFVTLVATPWVMVMVEVQLISNFGYFIVHGIVVTEH